MIYFGMLHSCIYSVKFAISFYLVGASTTQPDYLKFLFEMNESFCTLPSFGVIPSFGGLMGLASGSVPGLDGIDVTRVSINSVSRS